MRCIFQNLIVAVFILSGVMMMTTSAKGQMIPATEARSAGKPWLGIAIEKGKQGVLVKGVMPDTPAEQAGLKVGDEVLSIDKHPVNDPKELIALVQGAGIGQTVAVQVLRGKEKFTKQLKLVVRPDELKIIRDKLVGKPATKLNLEVVYGNQPGSSDKLKGRVVLLEFWATWCPACRASHKRLSEFAAKHPDISVLAVSDEGADELRAYASKVKPEFTILRDAEAKIQAEWMASSIPMVAVIDKSGTVRGITIGAGESLEESLAQALSISREGSSLK